MKNKIASFLHGCGISANFLTGLGLLLAALSGYLIVQSHLFYAGLALLASGLVDMMDGAVARVSNTQSRFGGILDSSLDRYGDGLVLGGILFFAYFHGRVDLAVLAMSAWIGTFSISYVRARAECEIGSCRVGFWERGERIGVLVIGLLCSNLIVSVLLLAIGTHWTVFQRLALAKISTGARPVEIKDLPFYLRPGKRSDGQYLLKVGVLVGLLVGLRF